MRTRLEGKLSLDRWGTQLRAGVENIKNYTYLANTSIPVKDSEGNVTGFKNNAAVRQHSGNIQIFTAMLQQKLKVGIHLDGEVAYQKSSEQDILLTGIVGLRQLVHEIRSRQKSTPDRNGSRCALFQ